MQQYVITLRSVDEVKDFVNQVTALREDVDVISGRYTVDGKSIMGLFSLDLGARLTVTVYGTDDGAYRRLLAPYLV